MTSPPRAYYVSCVPVALSALTGLSIDMIARALWHGGAVRPMGVAGSVALGTSTLDAMDLLAFRFGVRAALALPAGRLTAEETMTELAAYRHAGVVGVRRHRRAEAVENCSTSNGSGVTAADWPHAAGSWLLEVSVDGTGHALALIDGRIVAGGEQYAERAVRVGWQILNEEEEPCFHSRQ